MKPELRYQLNTIRAGLAKVLAGACCAERAADGDVGLIEQFRLVAMDVQMIGRRLDALERGIA